MQIGRLRHLIILLKQINRQNDYGATITDWKKFKTVWAEVRPLSGKEYYSAQQVQAEVTTQITLRYLPDIDSTMQIQFKDKRYEILSVINLYEQNFALQLMCKELIHERYR